MNMIAYRQVNAFAQAVSAPTLQYAQTLFHENNTAFVASPKIYKRFPQVKIDDFATILAAVWADSVSGAGSIKAWLRASTAGWSDIEITNAANVTYASWHGLLVRKNLQDVGKYPAVTNDYYSSPDVIARRQRVDDPGTFLTAQSYGTNPWEQPVRGLNYLYLRAKNLYPGGLEGNFVAYNYKGSVTPPSKWNPLSTETGSSTSAIKASSISPVLPSGQIGVTFDPFLFNFAADPGEHNCISVLAQTAYYTNPLPDDANFSIATWLLNDLASAWHNVAQPTQSKNFLYFTNRDDTPERFRFEAHVSNLPLGSVVQLRTEEKQHGGVEINSGPVHISSASAVIIAEGVINPKYDGRLEVTLDVPGLNGRLPPEAVVEIRTFWQVQDDNPNHAKAVVLAARNHRTLLDGDAAELFLGSFTFVGGSPD